MVKMNNIITNIANTYVITWPTEEIVESDVKVELNQLEDELDEDDNPEKNPLFDEFTAFFTVPFTELRKGINVFETYWVTPLSIFSITTLTFDSQNKQHLQWQIKLCSP